MAPFYDPNATAVADLIAALKPARIILYAGEGTEVDGAALVRVLQHSAAEIAVLRPEPPAFVHAKMVGIVSGDRGWLLSGSPNLSQAALGKVAQYGNCEAATLVAAPVDAVRGIFWEHLTWVPTDLEALSNLKCREEPQDVAPAALRLLRAWLTEDEYVAVAFRGGPGGADMWLRASLGESTVDLPVVMVADADNGGRYQATTTCSVNDLGPILAVCLVTDGVESGYVPLEDPTALRSSLRDTGTDRHGDPDGFSGADLNSPIGRLVSWMRQNTDYSAVLEDTSLQRTVSRGDAGVEGADDEEIALEDLEILVRRRAARRLHQMSPRLNVDDLLAEIEALRSQTPAPLRPPHAVTSETGIIETAVTDQPARRWTPERRLQVRLGHAIDRMCLAAGDIRIWERNPRQAARNIETMIDTLWICALTTEGAGLLSVERLPALLEHLLGSVIGSMDAPGLVWRISTAEHTELVSMIDVAIRTHLAELLEAFLCPKGQVDRPRVYAWQEYLAAGLDVGLVDGLDESRLQRLQDLATRTDDDHWPHTIHKRYGIDVRIVYPQTREWSTDVAEEQALWLLVPGEVDIFGDWSVVAMVVEWLNYKAPGGWDGRRVTVATGDPSKPTQPGSTRLAIAIGDTAWAQVSAGSAVEAREIITAERLRQMLRDRLPWRAVFPNAPLDVIKGLGA